MVRSLLAHEVGPTAEPTWPVACCGGFAVIAYPARYGVSGIMSFMVNQYGMVYEQNLGKDTAAITAEINAYNPDASWRQSAPSPILVNAH